MGEKSRLQIVNYFMSGGFFTNIKAMTNFSDCQVVLKIFKLVFHIVLYVVYYTNSIASREFLVNLPKTAGLVGTNLGLAQNAGMLGD